MNLTAQPPKRARDTSAAGQVRPHDRAGQEKRPWRLIKRLESEDGATINCFAVARVCRQRTTSLFAEPKMFFQSVAADHEPFDASSGDLHAKANIVVIHNSRVFKGRRNHHWMSNKTRLKDTSSIEALLLARLSKLFPVCPTVLPA